MGKLHLFSGYLLGLLCAATFAFPTIASAGALSVDVNPSTGHIVTNRSTVALPPRTTIGPAAANSPVFGPLPGGGAYQTTFSDITIRAANDGVVSSTNMTGRVRATAGAMKNGLGRCLTSFRCNLALMVGAAGIESLFDGIDWVMGEGGRPVKVSRPYPEGAPSYYGYLVTGMASAYSRCSSGDRVCFGPLPGQPTNGTQYACFLTHQSAPLIAYSKMTTSGGYPGTNCYYGLPNTSFIPPEVRSLVPPSEIAPAVDANYNPHPADLPYLSTGGLDWSHPGIDFEIVDIPPITGTENQTIIENANGTSRAIVPEYEFSWSSPSKQPVVNVQERIIDTTYSPTGEPISTDITTSNGAGSSANLPPEPPTDCDFMPTVCRFIDWFTEPDPDQGTEPDFSQLIDTVDIERDYNVGSSTASCPAPFHISLAWVPSVEVSLQPFCDLADMLRPLLLSLCFLFSGMIILRT